MDLSGADLGSLVAEMDLTGELAASMVNLTVGAPPICPELDATTEMMDLEPEAFHEVMQSLAAGPASAIADVDELYALDLPEGLHGGLAQVALRERDELLRRQAHVRQLRAAYLAALEKRRSGRHEVRQRHAP